MLLFIVAAAGLAGVELAVQALALAVHQELERLQAADAVGVRQAGLSAQQLSLGVLFLDLCLQVPATMRHELAMNQTLRKGRLKRRSPLSMKRCLLL